MENKTDVKAIMARFQANGSNSEEAPSASKGHPKQPLHPTLSGQALHIKRPVSDGGPGYGAAVPPKPVFPKNSVSSNSDPVVQEPNKTKALASMFANSQEETIKPFLKDKSQSKPSFTHMSEPKPLNKPGLSVTGSDSKPAFPKPAVISTKPSWVKEDSSPSASPSVPKIPPAQLKPSNSFFKLQHQIEGKAEVLADTVNKPTLPLTAAVKPSSFRAAQNLFNKNAEEQADSGVTPSAVDKLSPNVSHSLPPPKPPPSKKPSLKKPSPHIIDDSPSTPKKNPLLNSLALGPAPAKPNRPPNVNLEVFMKESETHVEGPAKTIHPPSLSINHSNHMTPAPPAAPSLPPRHPGAINQPETEEFYDDVDGLTNAPPPLPPVHPSQMLKRKEESDDEDGEMYEDLDDRWEAAEQKRDNNEKDDKEEKKRLEAEKKEQKEREKKAQEARKKFKLVGPLDVLQKGKARVDCKGNKTDLTLKQGDSLDIIRTQGNPEGKWLGRTQDGSVGFVKITSVEIDYNALKQKAAEQSYEPEVYDDIAVTPVEQSKIKGGGGGVVLPPLPGAGEDIYDDVDPSLDLRFPPPNQFSKDSDYKGGAIDEEIYDDVDAQSAPPPPPMSSIPRTDPKKQKKLEKEEKEFRKKFKYEGEIKVLHQVSIIPNVTNKKWSGKDLPLKAGEKLDVIVQAVDNKFICRNEDGKFGYVSTSYVVTDDGDIYDDIGDDNIYDND